MLLVMALFFRLTDESKRGLSPRGKKKAKDNITKKKEEGREMTIG